jgi:hypothetical protein
MVTFMSQPEFWDFPPTRRYYGRVDVTISRHRPPSSIVPAAIVVAVLVLWRFKLGLLMFAALAGWRMIATFLIVLAILSVIVWRERRVGRPF